MDNRIEIPIEFASDSDGKHFIYCKICNCDLQSSNTPYTIEKAYKRIDEARDITLFEIAICMDCAEKQSKTMSEESRQFIQSLIGNSTFLEKRQNLWNNNWKHNWNERCLFSNKKIQLNDEYHIIGQFQNGKVIPQASPFILGQDLIEEMQENLSKETKEEMDRFGEEFLGPDPTLKELFPDYQVIFV
ncbi:MAG: hypothetical protein WC994_10350 [Brumimicrobium sp.]